MSKIHKYERIDCFKTTDDEWYPNYTLSNDDFEGCQLVKVSFIEMIDHSWRVCVWGADDMGLERDFPFNGRDEAFALFMKLMGTPKINIKHLKTLGFYNA